MSAAGDPILILVENLLNEDLGGVIWNHPEEHFEILHKKYLKSEIIQ